MVKNFTSEIVMSDTGSLNLRVIKGSMVNIKYMLMKKVIRI